MQKHFFKQLSSIKTITATAPNEFLDDHEYQAIHRDGKFNISHKAILFCKVAQAIKCGQISLNYSLRYLSIDAYLLDEQYWHKHKTHLLEKLGLTEFNDAETVLSSQPVLNTIKLPARRCHQKMKSFTQGFLV